ncbi:hypothetical protein M072_4444 [Bacteroides fragilis str. DS-208]|nr:hypothetical protein M072_4444 [Bacteroides fragilis str. DS-208]
MKSIIIIIPYFGQSPQGMAHTDFFRTQHILRILAGYI